MTASSGQEGFKRVEQAYVFPDGLQIMPAGEPKTNHDIGSTIALFTIAVEGLSDADHITGSVTTYPLGSPTALSAARTAIRVSHYNEETPGTTASAPDNAINYLNSGPELLTEAMYVTQMANLTHAALAMRGIMRQQ